MARPPMNRAAVRKPTQITARNTTGKITRRPARFGHRLITLHVGSDKIPFTIHEDLLCSNSNYFKNLLQRGRKAVEGECSICTDCLFESAPICHCTTCGQNFHTECLDTWLQTAQVCPLCRAEWRMSQTINEATNNLLGSRYDDLWLNLYMHWLYTGSVSIPQAGPQYTPKSELSLLQSHVLGEKLEDELFLKKVRKEITGNEKIVQRAIDCTYLSFAYQFTEENSAARKFLVDLYLAQENPPKLDSNYPHQFALDVAQALLSRRTETDTDRKKVLAVHFPEEDADVIEAYGTTSLGYTETQLKGWERCSWVQGCPDGQGIYK